MKRFRVLLLTIPAMLAACGQPLVVAEATVDQEGGEAIILSELPIRLLPYNRDEIFDSLEAAAEEPEPAIPADLLAEQQRIQQAQETWRVAENRWSEVRDSMRSLSEQMQSLQRRGMRGTPQYRDMFQRFDRLEREERQVNQNKTDAFNRFSELQRAFLSRADSIRIARETWADRAFEDYDEIVTGRLEVMGLEEVADTTNGSGVATFRVPNGRWWVYTRYTLPFEELYWNVPIEVDSDSVHIRLDRSNAEVRPVF